MHQPNHAMVKAADSLMGEYGDAMSEAVFSSPGSKAQSNPLDEDHKKLLLVGALGLLSFFMLRHCEVGPFSPLDQEDLGRSL